MAAFEGPNGAIKAWIGARLTSGSSTVWQRSGPSERYWFVRLLTDKISASYTISDAVNLMLQPGAL